MALRTGTSMPAKNPPLLPEPSHPAGFLDYIRGLQELLTGEAPTPESLKQVGERCGTLVVGPPVKKDD